MNRPPKQTTIYIGLNDSETGVQRFPSEKYLSILKHACKSYKVAFSVQESLVLELCKDYDTVLLVGLGCPCTDIVASLSTAGAPHFGCFFPESSPGNISESVQNH